MRKRADVESTGKNEATGPRKPKDILGNKVSVKVSKVFATGSLSSVLSLKHSYRQLGWVGINYLFTAQCGDQRGSSLAGFCMQDQSVFLFLFLLAPSIQVSTSLFLFFL